MGRPVFPYELGDPDFSWLISNFQENNPEYAVVENSSLPVVFISVQSIAELVDPAEIPADKDASKTFEERK